MSAAVFVLPWLRGFEEEFICAALPLLDSFPLAKAMKVLKTGIYKSVNTSLFKTIVAPSVVKFNNCMLVFIFKCKVL